jgi:hypothetical protein
MDTMVALGEEESSAVIMNVYEIHSKSSPVPEWRSVVIMPR